MTISKLKGRPTHLDRTIICKILKGFPDDGSYIQRQDLKNKIGIHYFTLDKYLEYLHITGAIGKRIKKTRGNPIEYRLSQDFYREWAKQIKSVRKDLIKNLSKEPALTLKSDKEYIQAFHIFNFIQNINLQIIEILRSYGHTEKQKREMFDTYIFTINGMLKELTQLVSEPIAMTYFTYNILKMAYINPGYSNSIDNGIEKYADIMGLKKHQKEFTDLDGLEHDLGECPESLNYSLDELKKLFSQENLDKAIIKEHYARISQIFLINNALSSEK